ncbi:histidine phosphatase family protein [Gluconobacter wancherniae]|uniref:Phosphoglycerate mutase n=1 Tax=Gluconobacter wancherniae NBRC 103581 TaxID=656744 RepID=A0A511B250_9PROT|nr:histidine phosphatase family protein [Gluconobacter wancherniae]MBF0854659.1 histidine phosphatase family protein [Gluconobacter wancherniae]MBS1063742.1 histidine phosphatase family protein [Gluconobacter wancherniae]MBS1089564.1 histidine phosphatase family protein [Gluconobacter wancherniae]MBS1095337.1 histidine phosphatase family protein [Gluconobacter wancherniae]GBD57611.1 phosphoglycerate mutase [Gluconobacter wancherniae NBRC 103581]
MPKIIAKPYWYLRHGETDWNARGLSQGRTDIPLNSTGLAQAARAGAALAAFFQNGHAPFDRIVASPLTRALVTAEYARDAIRDGGGPDLPLTIDPELQEVCFGVQEGEPMGTWYDPWIEDGMTPEGAEPFAELRARAVTAINRELKRDGVPLFVAHGALFRGLRSGMGLPVNVRLANATPMHLKPSPEGWEIEIHNITGA